MERLEDRQLLTTFIVNMPGDSGAGSLRDAIVSANATPGADTITFDFTTLGASVSIQPATALPAITDSVTIDATIGTGYTAAAVVQLDGSNAGGGANGLSISAGGSVVRGLSLSNWGGSAIAISTAGGNTIQGNTFGLGGENNYGITVGSDSNLIGGSAAGQGNVIVNSDSAGIAISGNGTNIQGNRIGANASGSAALGNYVAGILVNGSNTTVGGTASGTGNLISGNFNDGIEVIGAGGATNIQGNRIGTDGTGALALGNGGNGILVRATAAGGSVTIGGTVPGARNVISASGGDGIKIDAAANTSILGNYLGVDATGKNAGATTLTNTLGNSGNGITVLPGSSNTTIGGASTSARNVISGNLGDGIRLGITDNPNVTPVDITKPVDSMPGTTVLGNYIGTDVTGAIATPNNGNGITAWVSGVTIGGTAAGAGNLVSANDGYGVYLRGSGNTLRGNCIGAAADGKSSLGNPGGGVGVDGNNNAIGGTAADAANIIAHNGYATGGRMYAGVTINTGTGNAIRTNSIYDNAALGINLISSTDPANGVTLNDSAGHTGPNLFQNFPVLASALATAGAVQVVGALGASPSSTYTIEFFASTTPDLTTYGEGQTYLGSIAVTTNSAGQTSFTANLPALPTGQAYITATATDAAGNTSEFSQYIAPNTPFLASGHVYRDTTGNGLTADDTPMNAVTVNAFFDANGSGALDSGDGAAVATAASDATGGYSFSLNQPGTYFLQEVTPSGYVRTWPATTSYYTVNAVFNGSIANQDFDNFRSGGGTDGSGCGCGCDDLINVTYTVNGNVVSDLRGNTHEGDTVAVTFTVPGTHSATINIVAYTAPGASFDANTAGQQQIWTVDGGTYGPGTHTIQATLPPSYYQVDLVCGPPIDHFGPAGSNIFYTPQGRLLSADNGGYHPYVAGSSSLVGCVFLDANGNGAWGAGDSGIGGVTVKLGGTTTQGNTVALTATTDANGNYIFAAVLPGTYQITQTQPAGYTSGVQTLGTAGGAIANNSFTITLAATAKPGPITGYNFAELRTAVATGDTATVGFWCSSNGQSLIKSFNGSRHATNLANWLAATLPRLCGSSSQNHLNNDTNSDVASLVAWLGSSTQYKPEAQLLATALSVYATTSSLGGTAAAKYGFSISATGTGTKTFNVGANGAAFGVANNTVLTVRQMLDAANARVGNGVLYNGNSSLRNAAWTVFNAINQAGGIS